MIVGNFASFRHVVHYISAPQPIVTVFTWLYPFSPTGRVHDQRHQRRPAAVRRPPDPADRDRAVASADHPHRTRATAARVSGARGVVPSRASCSSACGARPAAALRPRSGLGRLLPPAAAAHPGHARRVGGAEHPGRRTERNGARVRRARPLPAVPPAGGDERGLHRRERRRRRACSCGSCAPPGRRGSCPAARSR